MTNVLEVLGAVDTAVFSRNARRTSLKADHVCVHAAFGADCYAGQGFRTVCQ